ncbi:flagellar assembly protein FliH [Pseudomonadota bacterium]|nr:flagellar assembly protein FliH [Pseudomonadota bacterium]
MTSSKDELITEQSNVISPEEIATYQRWQEPRMVSVTDVEDQSMLTVEGIEKLHNEAREEGYKEGFEKGQSEGYSVGTEAGQQEIQQQVSLLQQVITRLNTPLAELDEQVEHDLIGLVMTMTRQLVRRELKADPEHVIGAVRAAMAVLPISDRKVKLFLHPSDVELVKTGLSIENDDTAWEWAEDPLLTRGGVRIETANTTVDATVEARLNSVINKLLGEERSDDSNE